MARRCYADPPYWGVCARYDHFHPDGRCWDDGETHRLLIERLNREFPDGWALSCKADAGELAQLIQWAELGGKVRVSPWVKPFASFKPGVNPGHCWEGVIWRTNAKRDRYEPTVKDFLSCNITMGKGLVGAKPPEFNAWVLQLLGMKPEDDLVDLFPGTGSMGKAWAELKQAATPICSNPACPFPRHDGRCETVPLFANQVKGVGK